MATTMRNSLPASGRCVAVTASSPSLHAPIYSFLASFSLCSSSHLPQQILHEPWFSARLLPTNHLPCKISFFGPFSPLPPSVLKKRSDPIAGRQRSGERLSGRCQKAEGQCWGRLVFFRIIQARSKAAIPSYNT